MPLAPESWTADMVLALPEDGQRYEVVHGELLVSPPPRWTHERVAGNLVFLLVPYCRQHPELGEVVRSPSAISWSPDTLVQPDIFVVSRRQSGGEEWSEITELDLVVEVLSPSTALHDRTTKRRLYQQNRVGVIWLIDTDRRRVEVWTPEARFPVIESENITWHPAGVREPLVIPISEFFRAD